MICKLMAALLAVALLTVATSADARTYRHHYKAKRIITDVVPKTALPKADPRKTIDANGNEARALGALVKASVEPQANPRTNPNAGKIVCNGRGGSTAIAGLHPVLLAKVKEITAACATHVVSTYCRGGATPNHRGGFAADLKGDPGCIYAHLKGWPGGYSTDYDTAPGTKHVHVSYNRAHEWNLRFAHRGGGSRTMSARSKGHAVYADAGPRAQFAYGNLSVH